MILIKLLFVVAGECRPWQQKCSDGSCVSASGECRKFQKILFIRYIYMHQKGIIIKLNNNYIKDKNVLVELQEAPGC